MLGKFHHLLRKLVLIILIVSAQTVQWALALTPVLLNTPTGTSNILFFSWLLDVVASCISCFVYADSFLIIIIAVIFPSISLLLSCLYLKPWILLFFPNCLPHPTGGEEREHGWLCGVYLPARSNHNNPMQIKQHHKFLRLGHISSSIHLSVKSQKWLPKNLKGGEEEESLLFEFKVWISALPSFSFLISFFIYSHFCVLSVSALPLLRVAPGSNWAVPTARHTPKSPHNHHWSLLTFWLENMNFLSPLLPPSWIYSSNSII